MTPEEKKSGVERLGPWFHQIDLGDGVRTKTASVTGEPVNHPLGAWKIVRKSLPDDLTGLRVLDVGCNGGFFAVEAKRRGAAYVLGVDSQRHQIRQAQFVRRALALDIDLRRLSVYDLSRRTIGEFDITLALGLVYHCKHLVLALERLFDVTRDTLILETAVLLPGVFPTDSVAFTVGHITRHLHPLAYFENTPASKESVFNWFLPSTSAMAALLKDVGFSDVSLSKLSGDRATFVCRKRQSQIAVGSLESFAASLTLESGPAIAARDSLMTFRIRAENIGLTGWRATAADAESNSGAVSLGIHLLQGDDEVDWDFSRTALRRDLPSGDAEVMTAQVYAPSEPGTYVLEFDMIAEDLSWFEDLGSVIFRHSLEVSNSADHIPWFRVEGLREGLETRGLKGLEHASCAELVDLAAQALTQASRVDSAGVHTAFTWILGFRPDASTVEELYRLTKGRSERFPIVVRRLLEPSEFAQIPRPPPAESLAGLTNRIRPTSRVAGITRHGESTCQSFPDEAKMAREVLREGRTKGDEQFVHLAYDRVLGRKADTEGAENAVTRLSAGALNRPHLLRDLLWSEELRGK